MASDTVGNIIIAIVTLINTVLLLRNGQRQKATHDLVNGQMTALISATARAGRAEGALQESKDSKAETK